jgi:putative phosphoribosyl transferase
MSQRNYKDRTEAGKLLAAELKRHAFADPVVLALPRGGVPIAVQVARGLGAPLDLVLVRKIGCPYHPELAVGAVVDGSEPEIVTNDRIIDETGTTQDYIEGEARRQLALIERRRQLWLAGQPRIDVKGKTAIIVDDGIATGATVRAAIHALRRQGARKIVVATAVAPPDTVHNLAREADEVIPLQMPDRFVAIGAFYDDFSQLSDAEVTAMLRTYRDEVAIGRSKRDMGS